jgi:hypothetical protein
MAPGIQIYPTRPWPNELTHLAGRRQTSITVTSNTFATHTPPTLAKRPSGSLPLSQHSFAHIVCCAMVICNLSLRLINSIPRHDDVWGPGDIAPPFLTSSLHGCEWSASRPGRFTPGTHSCGPGWTQSRSGSCGLEKSLLLLPGIHPRPQTPSPLLCSLIVSYPGSCYFIAFLTLPLTFSSYGRRRSNVFSGLFLA